MPKSAQYRLTWVPEHQCYVFHEADKHEPPFPFSPGSPQWFSWLSNIPSFTFTGKLGQFTARRETRGGAGTYWYAYRRQGYKMSKRYLGRTAALTLARLEEAALHLTVPPVSSSEQERSAENPLQGPIQARARNQALTPKAWCTTHEGASLAVQVASQTGTAPRVLHKTHDLLLATKFHPPHPRAQMVSRGPLVERLQQTVGGALTLISAPTGYGKTTLLAQWQASTSTPVVWLSLEPEDNEPMQFLTYLLAALQTFDRRLGVRAQTLLGLLQSVDLETVLALLINDLINWQGEGFALVLDDYHVITTTSIHHALTHLVEHLPPQVHLIIATQSDPPLPLARLRARGHLTELRVAELRFGVVSAGAFLENVMGLHLSPEEVTTLQTRTEGWIAGLQLAALSLQGRTDVANALAAFTGSHRFVLDYLSEEVLSRQPAPMQAFLLQTSILERLSGSLCDAVTRQEQSQAMLETMEKANLFVIALDDGREWYRYHHLFADLLRNHLSQAMPALLPELHRRASLWYEEHDVILEAVHHAILAPDLARTISLIEAHRHSLALHGQAHTVLHWLHTFPEELILKHPGLCLSQGLLLMFTGQLPEAFMRLQVAEQSASFITDEREAQAFLYQVAALQGYILFFQGDLESSISLAEQASDHLAQCPVEVREGVRVIAAHRVLLSGDVSHVEDQRVVRLIYGNSIGNDLSAMEVFLLLTDILLHARLLRLQARLRQAATIYEQMEQLLHDRAGPLISPGFCFGLGELSYEWNDLDMAERLLEQGREALRGSLPLAADAITQGYATLVRLHQARHHHTHALALVEELVELAENRQFAPVQRIRARAIRARLAVMQGDLAEAVRWANASGLSASSPLSYWREQEYLTFVRVRIAQGRLNSQGLDLVEALRLLEHLRADAEKSARMDSLLEILILQSLALFVRSAQKTQALAVLEQALELAEPEGYVRLFVDEGEPMVVLLRQAQARGIAPTYTAILLSACSAQPTASATLPLIEPLTERELAVLRLLMRGQSNAEIAQELIIAVGTVKRHVNSIYGKLGVRSRAQAIARAQALLVL